MEVKNYLLGYDNMYIMQDTDLFNFSLDSVLLPNFVTINPSMKKILDIGCGGGKNIERFAKQISENGRVVGIDYSEVSVEKSTKLNQEFIDQGIVNVLQVSVSEMPFYDETFDIVTGFETIYFWPDFINDLKEVNRVLKKDGLVFFCNEAVYR